MLRWTDEDEPEEEPTATGHTHDWRDVDHEKSLDIGDHTRGSHECTMCDICYEYACEQEATK